jgi:hypothetical protein
LVLLAQILARHVRGILKAAADSGPFSASGNLQKRSSQLDIFGDFSLQFGVCIHQLIGETLLLFDGGVKHLAKPVVSPSPMGLTNDQDDGKYDGLENAKAQHRKK